VTKKKKFYDIDTRGLSCAGQNSPGIHAIISLQCQTELEGATTFSITTLSITTLSTMALSIESQNAGCCYAVCREYLNVMLNVVMLSVVY
jgi:hypothetical protein